MGLDAALGEEAEGLAGLGALPRAEDLDFHGGRIYISLAPNEGAPLSSASTRTAKEG